MEDRDDLIQLLLDGLPADERSHVIDVIKQGDAEKLRQKRAEAPEQRGASSAEYSGGEDRDEDEQMADAED